jgi:2-dehydro-3-deoxyphosphogluconate aldolase / (4S)-4-hydroxy-2-oxoglutarate aldolase
MARHSRLNVLCAMKETGLVPVFYNADAQVAWKIVCACDDGGAKVVEFTNRGDRAVGVFTQLAEWRDKQRPELILGIGSICDAPTAAMYIAAGADFVVGPLLDEETAKVCNRRKIPYLPGCGTLSEIHLAHILGVEICKIFPGKEVGGPGFVKNVKGPCPWTEIMPTGGVEPTEESLSAWFKAGIACAGIGSNLITKELIGAGDFAGLTKKVQETLALIRKVRQGK